MLLPPAGGTRHLGAAAATGTEPLPHPGAAVGVLRTHPARGLGLAPTAVSGTETPLAPVRE